MDKIKRFLVYNDGVEYDCREAGEHETKVRKTWCDPSDVSQLEQKLEEAVKRFEAIVNHYGAYDTFQMDAVNMREEAMNAIAVFKDGKE